MEFHCCFHLVFDLNDVRRWVKHQSCDPNSRPIWHFVTATAHWQRDL